MRKLNKALNWYFWGTEQDDSLNGTGIFYLMLVAAGFTTILASYVNSIN